MFVSYGQKKYTRDGIEHTAQPKFNYYDLENGTYGTTLVVGEVHTHPSGSLSEAFSVQDIREIEKCLKYAKRNNLEYSAYLVTEYSIRIYNESTKKVGGLLLGDYVCGYTFNNTNWSWSRIHLGGRGARVSGRHDCLN